MVALIITRLPGQVPLVEQELLTLPEYLIPLSHPTSPNFRGVVLLDL
jgi:hypothetical protein